MSATDPPIDPLEDKPLVSSGESFEELWRSLERPVAEKAHRRRRFVRRRAASPEVSEPDEPLREDWGTYLRVGGIRRPPPFRREESFSLLYLEPDGRFLFIGFYGGYEYSRAAGEWTQEGALIALRGRGEVSNCSGAQDWRPFACRFEVVSGDGITALHARDDPGDGWSLLGVTAPLVYLGRRVLVQLPTMPYWPQIVPHTREELRALITGTQGAGGGEET